MDVLVSQFGELAVQVVGIVVMALATTIATQFAKAYATKMAVLKADAKNNMLVGVVERIVAAVEQQFVGTVGTEKFNAAAELVKDYAGKFKINLTNDEIKTLIESAVYGVKKGISEAKKAE